MSCQRAQEFLAQAAVSVGESVDAKKQRFGRDEALALARASQRLCVAKGKRYVELDLTRDAPDDDTLAALLLGPSGNLRAPAVRIADTLVIGFSAEMFERHFGQERGGQKPGGEKRGGPKPHP